VDLDKCWLRNTEIIRSQSLIIVFDDAIVFYHDVTRAYGLSELC